MSAAALRSGALSPLPPQHQTAVTSRSPACANTLSRAGGHRRPHSSCSAAANRPQTQAASIVVAPGPPITVPGEVDVEEVELDEEAKVSDGDELIEIEKTPAGSRNTSISEKYRAFLDAWDVGFTFNATELPAGAWLPCTSGALPLELEGTYFRNGPGRFTRGPDAYQHPYDGDGLVVSVAFRGGRAFLRSDFVKTPEYEAEAAAGRVLFRGTFGTQRTGGAWANMMDMYIKNTSNTGVLQWGNKLITMFEGSTPYALDPATLKTLGPELLGGLLRPGIPVDLGSARANWGFGAMQRLMGANRKLPAGFTAAGADACTAHPHVDSNTGRLCLWTYTMQHQGGFSAAMDTRITFRELLPGSMAVAASREYRMTGYGFLHDFAMTENYYIIFQPPVYTDVGPYMLGQVCAASSVRWRPQDPTIIHVIPRPGSDAERRGEYPWQIKMSPATFVFHHCNAYEDRARPGTIVVDSVHYDSLPAVGREALPEQKIDPDAGFRPRLRRVELDLTRGTATFSPAADHFSHYLEQPAINEARQGRRHRYVWGYSSIYEKAAMGIAKVDMVSGVASRWSPGPGYMCLEPEFVARPGAEDEDDGWLLCLGFDTPSRTSELLVLDAARPQDGPLARLPLPAPVPHGLHGAWSDTYYGPVGL